MEQYGLAILAVLLALAVALWMYGAYCYVQMVRHRRPGVNPFRVGWSAAQLTEQGRAFRRHALRAYAAFAVVALALIALGHLVGRQR
ncbi:MAG TPA: hypothetical protein VFM14_18405 [Gemmatimonadales bacterium]|nr:hypothetical protein [Gemmatimonadales bacterium]